jgi:hypothetical protein
MLRSYLKRFHTKRNRIPEVTEAAVIEDFYRGSNDSVFVRTILQKRRPPPSSCSGKRTSTSLLTNRLRTSSGERSLLRLHRGVTRTSNPTSVGRRGLVKRFTLLDHPSLVPEVHPAKASGHWTTSSMPSARITRICATPCGTVETSSILSGMVDRSNLYHLPHREGARRASATSAIGRGRGWSVTPGFRRQIECEPCTCQDQQFTYTAVT